MRIIMDGQQLPVTVRASRDLLQAVRSIALAKNWRIHYDAANGLIYLNTESHSVNWQSERQSNKSIELDSTRLLGKVICLDPGHGGKDPGAIGPAGTCEKDHTLAIALILREKLERNGARVCMTRDSDRQVAHESATAQEELEARVLLAKHEKADIFISIHNDGFISPDVCGTTTYHHGSPDATRLAAAVQQKLVESLGTKDRGSRYASFYVIRQAAMPAILVEVAFISNHEEEMLLASDEGRFRTVDGIFEGIVTYFKV